MIARRFTFYFAFSSSVALWSMLMLHACVTSTKNPQIGDDWERIVQRDTLVVLTENSASTYYQFGDVELGFEFELIKAFAREHKLHVQMKIVDDVDSMFKMIQSGEADIACSNLTYTSLRDSVVDFSQPIYATRQVLVQRAFDQARPHQKFTLLKAMT